MSEGELATLRERLRALEEDVRELRQLAQLVGENTATLRVLLQAHNEVIEEIGRLREDFDEKLEELKTATTATTSLKTLITFSATVIVPILIAILGGYFALKSGGGFANAPK